MENKIFLIAVDVKDESRHIEDFVYRKVIAKDEEEAKQIVFEEIQDDYDFDEFEEFEGHIYFCDEIDTTTKSQSFGCGY
jgi:hypothetical protein